MSYRTPATTLPACISAPGTSPTAGLSAVQQAMAHWRTVRSLGASQQIVVHHIGDSIGTGSVASDWKLGYAELVRAWMIATLGMPLAADFIVPMYATGWSGGGPSGTLPFTLGANGADLTGWGYQFLPAWTAANFGTNPLVFNSANMPSPNCVNLDLHWLNRGGTATRLIDGGSSAVITNANDNTWTIEQVSSLASASHTITLSAQSTDETGLLGGITTYPGARNAAGLCFARIAGAGRQANHWNGSGTRPANQFKNLSGGNYHAGSSGFPGVGSDLLLLELGINDMQNAVSAANFLNAYQQICAAERAGNANCSIVFIIPNSEDPTFGQVTSGNWTAAQTMQQTYKPLIYQIAQAYGAVVVDVDQLWGNNGVTLALVAANQPHPTTLGHSATGPYGIAYLLEQLLAA